MKHGPFHIEIYKSRSANPKQRYRWKAITTGNGKKVANGGEGYLRMDAAADMANYLMPGATEIRYPDGYKPKEADKPLDVKPIKPFAAADARKAKAGQRATLSE